MSSDASPTPVWGISQFDHSPTHTNVSWTCTLQDGDETAVLSGSISLEPGQVIPFMALREETLIQMTQTALGAKQLRKINSALTKQIETQRSV